jgi:WD40 repeat protein
MKQEIIQDDEESLDELVVRARSDSRLREIIGQVAHIKEVSRIRATFWSSDCGVAYSHRYVAGALRNTLILEEHVGGELREKASYSMPDDVIDIAISKDETTIAAVCRDCSYCLLEIGENKLSLIKEESLINGLSGVDFSDISMVLSYSGGAYEYLFDNGQIRSQARSKTAIPLENATCVAYLDDMKLACGNDKGKVIVNDFSDRKVIDGYEYTKTEELQLSASVRGIGSDYKGNLAVLTDDNHLRIYRYDGKLTQIHKQPIYSEAMRVALHPDGTKMVTSNHFYRLKR